MTERCDNCFHAYPIKNGQMYKEPDWSIRLRTGGSGIHRGCIKHNDDNVDQILITTDLESSCIFPERFIQKTAVLIKEKVF